MEFPVLSGGEGPGPLGRSVWPELNQTNQVWNGRKFFTTEHTESTEKKTIKSLCSLCALW